MAASSRISTADASLHDVGKMQRGFVQEVSKLERVSLISLQLQPDLVA